MWYHSRSAVCYLFLLLKQTRISCCSWRNKISIFCRALLLTQGQHHFAAMRLIRTLIFNFAPWPHSHSTQSNWVLVQISRNSEQWRRQTLEWTKNGSVHAVCLKPPSSSEEMMMVIVCVQWGIGRIINFSSGLLSRVVN